MHTMAGAPDPRVYRVMARYNRWMNAKVYDACAQIDDAERRADRGAFFRSIHGTLNHLLFGDLAWMSRFTCEDLRRGARIGDEIHASFDELRAAREAFDGHIVEWADALVADWLDADFEWTSGVDGQTRVMPAWLLVQHMFNHQTHHRGQLTTLLSQLGIDVGSTDLPWMPDAADLAR